MDIEARIGLVVMPFFSVTRASLGASLLKGACEKAGFGCDIHYLNVPLAAEMNFLEYSWVGELSPPSALLGDWLFSPWAHGEFDASGEFPARAQADATYFTEVLLSRFAGQFAHGDALRLLKIRETLGDYLNRCLDSHDWGSYRIIGFTTTFNQNCASLALARMIKQRFPHVCIVFGGANCEGDMGPGLLENYSCIDAICSGEGEESFSAFIRSVLIDGVVRSVGNIKTRSDLRPAASVAAVDLDTLPYPQFEEYYSALALSGLAGQFEPLVPFETSRGCWWGEKHHCTFCGLNGLSMKFRSKSQDRALEEITFLSGKWGQSILCVDNILDLKYFENFLPGLASRQLGLNLHYEVKVNLTKNQLRSLASAGVSAIQPGIESFSDSILHLMDKGSSRLQNIQLMRWCRELGVQAAWNVLYGFPGEDVAEYAHVIELLPQLAHLDPPQHCGQVRADRHSPYFSQPKRYNIDLVLEPAYAYVYPIDKSSLARIAYYFDMGFSGKSSIAEYEVALHDAVSVWHRRASDGALFHLMRERSGYFVRDSRRDGPMVEITATAEEAALLLAADAITGFNRLESLKLWNGVADPSATHTLVEQLVAKGWLLRDGNRFLTLPVLHPSCGE